MWNKVVYTHNHFVFSPLFFFIVAVILAFEIWMLVDALQNDHISDTARIWWVLGIVFIHPFVAIIYYFTDYQKNVR